MKVKVNSRIESIFSYAVAMDNRGLRNTIHCIGANIFIVNFDHSMILRFLLRKSEVAFASAVSFNANDYDSPEFEVSNGKIIFKLAEGRYERRKICSPAGYNAQDIRRLYHKYILVSKDYDLLFYLSRDCCSLLDEQLSHTEISVEKGRLTLRQRNIYTGTIIEVTPRSAGLIEEVKLPESFGAVGVKTKDFMSLFTLYDSLAFTPAGDFMLVRDYRKKDFDGLIAFCKYDEIIKLYEEEEREGGETEDGWKKQKIRRSK